MISCDWHRVCEAAGLPPADAEIAAIIFGDPWFAKAATIFEMRFPANGSERATYREIGSRVNLSREGIRYHLDVRLRRLRRAVKGYREREQFWNDPNRGQIEQIDFSMRTYNCLRKAGAGTVDDLTTRSEKDLMALRNFGVGCLAEVKHQLSAIGLSLRVDGDSG